MTTSFTIAAADNSFAVATGDNVNIVPGQSRFDYPPNSSKNLVITTKDGDPDPRVFEVGDTYDLSWQGNGGGDLTDVVVIRSDPAPDSGGIVVFEGIDDHGDPVQVIWTPNFDLENWYWTNYGPHNSPNFYTTDQNASYDHEFVCFERGVRLATPRGLIPAGKLRVGETVCTWGGVAREIRWVGRKSVMGDGVAAPIRFAPGSIGNFAPVKLSPQHRVLVTAPQAELSHGASEVFVPAISLVDGHRVRQVQKPRVTYVHILLDRHDVLIAEGAPCESLLPGFRTRDCLTAADRADIRAATGGQSYDPAYALLRRREAEALAPYCRVPEREPAMF